MLATVKWMESVRVGYAEILMNVGLTTKHDATEASRRIYTSAVIAELESLLDEAVRLSEGVFTRRVNWISAEYLGPLRKAYQ